MSDAEIGTWKENPNICFACSSFLEVPDDSDVLLDKDEQEHLFSRFEDAETKSFHG